PPNHLVTVLKTDCFRLQNGGSKVIHFASAGRSRELRLPGEAGDYSDSVMTISLGISNFSCGGATSSTDITSEEVAMPIVSPSIFIITLPHITYSTSVPLSLLMRILRHL